MELSLQWRTAEPENHCIIVSTGLLSTLIPKRC